MKRCPWCAGDHALVDCKRIPAERTEPVTAIAERMMQFRMFSGQLLREMREAGCTPSPATMALNPDHG